MAIGLDNWNELENRDIPKTRVKKMRVLEKRSKLNPDEDSDDSDAASLESEFEEVEALHVEAEHVIEDPVSESESSCAGTFVYCDVCRGRKFLTEKDIEDHLKSKAHLKRVAAQEAIVTPTKLSEPVNDKKKKWVKSVSDKPKMNRKARRAALVDSRT